MISEQASGPALFAHVRLLELGKSITFEDGLWSAMDAMASIGCPRPGCYDIHALLRRTLGRIMAAAGGSERYRWTWRGADIKALLDDPGSSSSRQIRPNCRCSINTSYIPRNKRTANAERDQLAQALALLRSAQRHPPALQPDSSGWPNLIIIPSRTDGRESTRAECPVRSGERDLSDAPNARLPTVRDPSGTSRFRHFRKRRMSG